MAGTKTLFDLLEKEWVQLRIAPSTCQQLRRWGTHDSALAFSCMDDLMAEMAKRNRPHETDEVMPALVRRAQCEELAARTLLQLLLPGCKALASRYSWMGEPDEVASLVVVAVYERIRAYPVDSRKQPARRGWVAADILMGARQQLWRRGQHVPHWREVCIRPCASNPRRATVRGPSAPPLLTVRPRTANAQA